jgi:hypothetical protein
LARFLRDHGYEARRGVQYQGGPESPDVVSSLGYLYWESKRTEALSLYPALKKAATEAKPNQAPIVAHRRNGERWVGIMYLDDLLNLLPNTGEES